jgi:hypothetical protein
MLTIDTLLHENAYFLSSNFQLQGSNCAHSHSTLITQIHICKLPQLSGKKNSQNKQRHTSYPIPGRRPFQRSATVKLPRNGRAIVPHPSHAAFKIANSARIGASNQFSLNFMGSALSDGTYVNYLEYVDEVTISACDATHLKTLIAFPDNFGKVAGVITSAIEYSFLLPGSCPQFLVLNLHNIQIRKIPHCT